MLVQGPPKKHKKYLHLNKLVKLSKRDASNLKSDSEHLAKSKLEYKFSALYLLPKIVMGFQSEKNHSRDTRVPKGAVWSKFQVTISRKTTWSKGLIFVCVHCGHNRLF